MEEKYELTDETIEYDSRILHRIRALKDFNNVKKGDLGGYVESEWNLGHLNDCWIYDDAKVFDNAMVYGDAIICNDANVYGDARVFNKSKIYDYAKICGNVQIYDYAEIYGRASVHGNSIVNDNAKIYGNVNVCRHIISHNAYIRSNMDFMSIDGLGSENRTTYFYRTDDNDVYVLCGCFSGTLKEFEEKVKETYPNCKYGEEYLAMCKVVKIHFNKC